MESASHAINSMQPQYGTPMRLPNTPRRTLGKSPMNLRKPARFHTPITDVTIGARYSSIGRPRHVQSQLVVETTTMVGKTVFTATTHGKYGIRLPHTERRTYR